ARVVERLLQTARTAGVEVLLALLVLRMIDRPGCAPDIGDGTLEGVALPVRALAGPGDREYVDGPGDVLLDRRRNRTPGVAELARVGERLRGAILEGKRRTRHGRTLRR